MTTKYSKPEPWASGSKSLICAMSSFNHSHVLLESHYVGSQEGYDINISKSSLLLAPELTQPLSKITVTRVHQLPR